MVYHNYCMRLFAACMIFNDLVIKKAKYPKAFDNLFPPKGYVTKNGFYLFFNMIMVSRIERKTATCNKLPLICDTTQQ